MTMIVIICRLLCRLGANAAFSLLCRHRARASVCFSAREASALALHLLSASQELKRGASIAASEAAVALRLLVSQAPSSTTTLTPHLGSVHTQPCLP